MDDKFEILINEAVQLFQKGDVTIAREKYESLISYQREKINKNPESNEEKANFGCVVALLCFINDEMPADKKLVILGDGASLFEEILHTPDYDLEPIQKFWFCDIFDARGRTFFDIRNYDSALKNIDMALKLYDELKENLTGQMWCKIAALLALKGVALYENDRNTSTAHMALKVTNKAIGILEQIKQASPKDYSNFQDLLPNWYKVRDDLSAITSPK